MTDQPTIPTPERYRITEGYVEYADGPAYFADDGGDGLVHQPDVYPYAQALAELGGVTRIIDLGCGRGGKLAAMHAAHPEWEFVGVDHGDNIEWCREAYSWGLWVEANLDYSGHIAALAMSVEVEWRSAVVIVADVIEHLRNPEHLAWLLYVTDPSAIVLSSPCRFLTWGGDHLGPPPNMCHVREWTCVELLDWLRAEQLGIVHASHTRADENDEARTAALITAVAL